MHTERRDSPYTHGDHLLHGNRLQELLEDHACSLGWRVVKGLSGFEEGKEGGVKWGWGRGAERIKPQQRTGSPLLSSLHHLFVIFSERRDDVYILRSPYRLYFYLFWSLTA